MYVKKKYPDTKTSAINKTINYTCTAARCVRYVVDPWFGTSQFQTLWLLPTGLWLLALLQLWLRLRSHPSMPTSLPLSFFPVAIESFGALGPSLSHWARGSVTILAMSSLVTFCCSDSL